MAYPVGMPQGDGGGGRSWNAGSVDSHNDADDVGYFTQVVHYLANNLNADARSVFLTGMSNGGFMANRLACAWADSNFGIDVRAIAPALGGMAKMKYDAKCAGAAYKLGGVVTHSFTSNVRQGPLPVLCVEGRARTL